MYLFLSLFYPPLSLSMSCSSNFTYISFDPLLISAYLSYIDIYLFLSLCQSKFRPISFNPVFFISAFSSYIHLYLSLCLVYPPLFLLYFFVNPDWCLSISISLLIQIHAYLFQSHFLYLCLFFVYPPIFVSMSCLSTSISFIFLCQSRLMPNFFYPFVNPNWCLSLSIQFSLSLSNTHLSTCIYFYLFSIHHYLSLSLVYPTLHISLSIPFS